MANRNHLNVTITGTYMDDNGEQHEINVTHEDRDFINVNTFKWYDDDNYEMDDSVVGQCNFIYLVNIIEETGRRMGVEAFQAMLEIIKRRMEEAQAEDAP